VHGEVDARLAGTLQVQDDGILDGGVIKACRLVAVFLAHALQAALDGGDLVDDRVVTHGSGPRSAP
jgi:hypothetical protein